MDDSDNGEKSPVRLRRRFTLHIMLNEQERAAMKRKAESTGELLSAWSRRKLREAAGLPTN